MSPKTKALAGLAGVVVPGTECAEGAGDAGAADLDGDADPPGGGEPTVRTPQDAVARAVTASTAHR